MTRLERFLAGHALLSRREREVFALLAEECLQTKEVAVRLCIGAKTVETHRARVNRKLGVHTSAELVWFAAVGGMLWPARACIKSPATDASKDPMPAAAR